jgi:hypothetical protein
LAVGPLAFAKSISPWYFPVDDNDVYIGLPRKRNAELGLFVKTCYQQLGRIIANNLDK